MDKSKSGKEQVKFNYPAGKGRYLLLTGKTGCPSAEFRSRPDSGLVVSDTRDSSAEP